MKQLNIFDYLKSDDEDYVICDACWKPIYGGDYECIDDMNLCPECKRRLYGELPPMPEEYYGEYKTEGGYTKSRPREWTKKELEWVKELRDMGYSCNDIADSIGRTRVSVSVKMKRISKKRNDYNKDHYVEKYEINKRYLAELKPRTVLDLFCGERNYYADYTVTTNDKNPEINADYHDDAFKVLCKLYAEGKKYDLIDLDPFGSAYDCFDLAIKMATKGIVITLGELGHKRFGRLDYVRYRYGIDSMDDFTMETLINRIQEIGLRNKKKLTVYEAREWRNIGRVWMLCEPYKVTEQWENEKEGEE